MKYNRRKYIITFDYEPLVWVRPQRQFIGTSLQSCTLYNSIDEAQLQLNKVIGYSGIYFEKYKILSEEEFANILLTKEIIE